MASKGSVGEIFVDLSLNSKGFQKQFNKTINSTVSNATRGIEKKISGLFSKIGKIAAVGLSTKAIVEFSKEAINLGSDLAEVQNVVDVVYGDMNDQVDTFAKNAAKNAGLSETMAKKYVGTFGAMSKSFGFTTEQALTMSESLTQLAGDVASFYNISQDEAYTKLKSVFTGETETLKELGVVMTQNALDQFALANGYGKTTSAMSEQEKVALRYAFVCKQLSVASGDFIRTQNSWANQMRLLSLQWKSLMANIGQGLINIFLPAIQLMNQVMGKLVQLSAGFKAFVESITGKKKDNPVASAMQQAGSAVNDASASMGNLSDNTDAVGDSAKSAANKIKKSIMAFDKLNTLTDNKSSSGSGSSGKNKNASGLGSNFKIEPFGLDNIDTSKTAENIMSDFCNNLAEAIKKGDWYRVGYLIGQKLGQSLEGIKWDKIYAKSKKIATNIADAINGFVDGYHWKTLGNTIGNGFNVAFGFVDTMIHKTNFVRIGYNIAEMLNEQMKATDWELFGRTLTNGLYIAFNFLHGFVETFDFKEFGTSLGIALMAAINNIDWVQAAKDMSNLVIGIANMITNMCQQIDFNKVRDTILQMIQAVDWGQLLSAVFQAILAAWPVLGPIFGAKLFAMIIPSLLGNLTKLILGNVTKWLGSIFFPTVTAVAVQGAGQVSGGFFSKILAACSSFKSWLTGTLIPGIKSAIMAFVGFLQANPIVLIISAIVALVALIAVKGDEIKKVLNGLADWLQGIFTTDWRNSFGVIGNLVNAFCANLNNLLGSARNIFNGLIDFIRGVFTGDWGRAWNGVVEVFKGAFGLIASVAKAPLNGLIGLVNMAIDGLNKISVNVPDWVPGVGGKHFGFSIPNIPYLANGGYVKANTPQLAMIGDNRHQGEYVTPEKKLNDAVSNQVNPLYEKIAELIDIIKNNPNGGSGGDITIPIILDGNVIDSRIITATQRQNLRTGGRA